MINIKKLDMAIIPNDTLMRIINDPYIRSVTPYADRKKGLQCYSVVTAGGERYKVFTHGTVL